MVFLKSYLQRSLDPLVKLHDVFLLPVAPMESLFFAKPRASPTDGPSTEGQTHTSRASAGTRRGEADNGHGWEGGREMRKHVSRSGVLTNVSPPPRSAPPRIAPPYLGQKITKPASSRLPFQPTADKQYEDILGPTASPSRMNLDTSEAKDKS